MNDQGIVRTQIVFCGLLAVFTFVSVLFPSIYDFMIRGEGVWGIPIPLIEYFGVCMVLLFIAIGIEFLRKGF